MQACHKNSQRGLAELPLPVPLLENRVNRLSVILFRVLPSKHTQSAVDLTKAFEQECLCIFSSHSAAPVYTVTLSLLFGALPDIVVEELDKQ